MKPRPRRRRRAEDQFTLPQDRTTRAYVNRFADANRAKMTLAEQQLDEILHNIDCGAFQGCYKTQHVFHGKWILDFFFPAVRLGIEVDGSSHCSLARQARDREKEADCVHLDITLVRVTNAEVRGDRDKLVAKLREALAVAETRPNRTVGTVIPSEASAVAADVAQESPRSMRSDPNAREQLASPAPTSLVKDTYNPELRDKVLRAIAVQRVRARFGPAGGESNAASDTLTDCSHWIGVDAKLGPVLYDKAAQRELSPDRVRLYILNECRASTFMIASIRPRLRKCNEPTRLSVLEQVRQYQSAMARRRSTHCFSCRMHLDSVDFSLCVACRWIRCSCGACDCTRGCRP